MTRAKDELILLTNSEPSPFLSEIPAANLENGTAAELKRPQAVQQLHLFLKLRYHKKINEGKGACRMQIAAVRLTEGVNELFARAGSPVCPGKGKRKF